MLPESKGLFSRDLENLHLVYDVHSLSSHFTPIRPLSSRNHAQYEVHSHGTGETAKWRYEIWFATENRVVYSIHGGPMAGRRNYQTAMYQCIRPGELWQCSWLEETGTIVRCLSLSHVTSLD